MLSFACFLMGGEGDPRHAHAKKRMIIASWPGDVGNHSETTVTAKIQMRLKQG